uniref:Reverse transcriptase zinc-binding domain-containing protein n=1 Tax=Sorghum bicolor TaxID=4558 RepID=C6JRM6_SORBI
MVKSVCSVLLLHALNIKLLSTCSVLWFRKRLPADQSASRVGSRSLISRLKWWKRSIAAVPKEIRKGLNSLIILVAWEIWKHRNSCVFDNKRPNIQEVFRAISSEEELWCSAGASKLQELVLRSRPFET